MPLMVVYAGWLSLGGSIQALPKHRLGLQGKAALAAAPWLDSLRFLLTAAPLSAEDCCLWMELLPLLQQLVEAAGSQHSSGQSEARQLLAVAEQFVGGTALAWVQQQTGIAQAPGVQAALLPEVLHTVCRLVELGMVHGSCAQRQQLLAAMHSAEWLGLLPTQLASCSYATRVVALRLATVLVGAHAGCGPAGLSAGQLFAATVRQVLMPRHLWGTQHHHGKAAVLAALKLLHLLTQAAPMQEWAAAWAESGTTYWLSRAIADSSAAVRIAAMRLLAAALAAPATHMLLQAAWPECGAIVAGAAAAADEEPLAFRIAALSAVAALLSHGASRQQLGFTSAGTAAVVRHAEAAATSPDLGAKAASPAANRGCNGAVVSASQEVGAAYLAEASLQLAYLPPSTQPLSAEAFLRQAELWAGVHSVLQVRASAACCSQSTFVLPTLGPTGAFNSRMLATMDAPHVRTHFALFAGVVSSVPPQCCSARSPAAGPAGR